tara:strand:+ start:9214 stop:9855 length:642 start_codon:yes stop_codon:yes gene_type:complete
MGILYKLLVLFLVLPLNLTLMPKRLPNGKPYKYISNRNDRSSDLKVIKPGQASLISRNWLQNIVADLFNRENKMLINNEFTKTGIYNYDELHIVTSINRLEAYIQESYNIQGKNNAHLFLAWMPKGIYGREEALFIIVAEISVKSQEFIIKHLVQSPFWDQEQIDSNELRLALIEQNERNNCTKINLEYLYEQDLRYKLAWATWNLNSNITME